MGIYKITNQINGKVYIGQSINIEHRWKEHIQEAKHGDKKYKIYLALRKYGIENFKFEILEECQREELNEKEIFYIEKYNSYYDGYNSNLGGQGKGFQKVINPEEIYQLWDAGLSMKEICDELKNKVGHTTIKKYLSNYKNYSATESNRRGILRSEKVKNHLNNYDGCYQCNKVYQYDLWGNFIAEYSSYAEAERKTRTNKDTIGRVINGKQEQAGGYQWVSDKSEVKDLTKTIRLKFGVIQYDLNNNEIRRFNTLQQAAIAMGCDSSAISKVCKHQRKTSCGYKWEYDYSIWNGQKIN